MRLSFLFLSIIFEFFCFGLKSENQKVSFLFIGDIMLHGSQLRAGELSDSSYDFKDCYKYIKPVFNKYDYVVGNFETAIGAKPYIGYPYFSSPPELVTALKYAGINVLAHANNHAFDQGREGMFRTLNVLDSMSYLRNGTYRNRQERDAINHHIIEKNGIRVAMLNYTYGSNGFSRYNDLILNKIDSAIVVRDIIKAKSLNPDKIIVFMHYGKEYQHQPTELQKKYTRICFDNGADMIVGSHAHVVQRIEKTSEGKIVAYGLGNFVSNQRWLPSDGGLMFSFEIEKNESGINFPRIGYVYNWVLKATVGSKYNFYVLPAALYEDSLHFFADEAYYDQMLKYLDFSRRFMKDEKVVFPEFRF